MYGPVKSTVNPLEYSNQLGHASDLAPVCAGDYGSDYGDDGYGAPAGAIMESIREEDHSPGSARSQRHAEASRFSPGPLESVPEPIPEQSVSPRQSDFGAKRPELEAGPVRPLAPQANAGKAARYDEDGFLLDDEEETPQPPMASRAPPPTRPITTPPKPPSEYDLAYDSSPAPSPRASHLMGNQTAVPEQPSTAAMASHQVQQPQQSTAESTPRDLAHQISRLAEEESDEDDFLAAAVAAVEAQDKQKGSPAPAQRAQQVQPDRLRGPTSAGQPAAPTPQLRQQPPQPQRPAANEAFLPSDDEASPMAIQNQNQQQSRQNMPAIPPSVPRTWERPSSQQRPPVDSEDTPQRSEQSLRSRYGAQRSPSPANDASAGAAAAFLAARTGSGNAPPAPQPQAQPMSSRPLLAGSTEQQRPGPVPIARPPTSAYNNAGASGNSAAVPASDAPKPSSKWFRKTPPVAAPVQAQPQVQPKPADNDPAYNPFDSPVSQNGDGRLSPMALAKQQEQQQRQQQLQQQPAQKPMQEQGMYMDESDEEEEQSTGRMGGQQAGQGARQGFNQEQGMGQQPQMNRISPRGAISAGVGGETACLSVVLQIQCSSR